MKIRNLKLSLDYKSWQLEENFSEAKKQEILACIDKFTQETFIVEHKIETSPLGKCTWYKFYYYELEIGLSQEILGDVGEKICLQLNLNGTKELTEQVIKFASQKMVNHADNVAERIKNGNNKILKNLAKNHS